MCIFLKIAPNQKQAQTWLASVIKKSGRIYRENTASMTALTPVHVAALMSRRLINSGSERCLVQPGSTLFVEWAFPEPANSPDRQKYPVQ